MNRAGMSCPFVAGSKIEDSSRFAGRREELKFLADRMSGSQPVSVNVVGERLSGKSSLLQHFTDIWPHLGPDSSRFLVVFICLRLNKPKTEAEFYQTLAAALHDKLPDAPAVSSSSAFEKEILDKLAGQGLLPVFCLDEFEKLFDHIGELNKDFYDRLGGLIKTNRMMLIIATRKPLKIYGEEYQLESAFFTFGMMQRLGDFSDDEADELLLLPDPAAPALDIEERKVAKELGGRTPYRLQLAAFYLFEARRCGKNTAWAKRQFKEQLGQTKLRSIWTRPLGLVLRSRRKLLDPLAEDSEKCRKVLVNIVLPLLGILAALLLLGLWLAGWLTSAKLLELYQQLRGLL